MIFPPSGNFPGFYGRGGSEGRGIRGSGCIIVKADVGLVNVGLLRGGGGAPDVEYRNQTRASVDHGTLEILAGVEAF